MLPSACSVQEFYTVVQENAQLFTALLTTSVAVIVGLILYLTCKTTPRPPKGPANQLKKSKTGSSVAKKSGAPQRKKAPVKAAQQGMCSSALLWVSCFLKLWQPRSPALISGSVWKHTQRLSPQLLSALTMNTWSAVLLIELFEYGFVTLSLKRTIGFVYLPPDAFPTAFFLRCLRFILIRVKGISASTLILIMLRRVALALTRSSYTWPCPIRGKWFYIRWQWITR